MTSTRENCLGNACPAFGRCHVVAARREAQAADIVVVNHHLLLADLALKDEGFGELLPGTEAVILDEAHQVPEIAAQFFGREFSSRQAALFARDALAELGRLGLAGSAPRERLAALEAALAEAAAALSGSGERTDWAALPDAFVAALDRVREALSQLAVELAALDVDDPALRSAVRRARTPVQSHWRRSPTRAGRTACAGSRRPAADSRWHSRPSKWRRGSAT